MVGVDSGQARDLEIEDGMVSHVGYFSGRHIQDGAEVTIKPLFLLDHPKIARCRNSPVEILAKAGMAQFFFDENAAGIGGDDELILRAERLNHLGNIRKRAYIAAVAVQKVGDGNTQTRTVQPVTDIVPQEMGLPDRIVCLLDLGRGILLVMEYFSAYNSGMPSSQTILP